MAKQLFRALVAFLAVGFLAGCGVIEVKPNPVVRQARVKATPPVTHTPPVSQDSRGAASADLAGPAWLPVPGKQYAYATGRYLQLEFRVVLDTLNVRKTYEEYHADPKHQGHKPIAYMSLVSERARARAPGYQFANCGLRINFRIEGVRLDPMIFKHAEFPVLNRNRVMIGTVKPAEVGPTWIEFRDFDLRDGAVNVVLPYAFGPKGEQRMMVEPVGGWRGIGRSYKNGIYEMDFSHRLNNPGFIPELIVDAASVKDLCRTF